MGIGVFAQGRFFSGSCCKISNPPTRMFNPRMNSSRSLGVAVPLWKQYSNRFEAGRPYGFPPFLSQGETGTGKELIGCGRARFHKSQARGCGTARFNNKAGIAPPFRSIFYLKASYLATRKVLFLRGPLRKKDWPNSNWLTKGTLFPGRGGRHSIGAAAQTAAGVLQEQENSSAWASGPDSSSRRSPRKPPTSSKIWLKMVIKRNEIFAAASDLYYRLKCVSRPVAAACGARRVEDIPALQWNNFLSRFMPARMG